MIAVYEENINLFIQIHIQMQALRMFSLVQTLLYGKTVSRKSWIGIKRFLEVYFCYLTPLEESFRGTNKL